MSFVDYFFATQRNRTRTHTTCEPKKFLKVSHENYRVPRKKNENERTTSERRQQASERQRQTAAKKTWTQIAWTPCAGGCAEVVIHLLKRKMICAPVLRCFGRDNVLRTHQDLFASCVFCRVFGTKIVHLIGLHTPHQMQIIFKVVNENVSRARAECVLSFFPTRFLTFA